MQKIFTIFVLILAFSLSSAQNSETPHYNVPRDFSFIKYDIDTLSFSMDTSLLVPFFQKLNQTINDSTSNINIVHIGGSHVQGGTFPHAIRRELILHYDTCFGERGMIFPYSVAPRCNNPRDYTLSDKGKFRLIRNVYKDHKRPLQTTGIGVYTGDTIAEFTIKMNEPSIPFTFNKISLLAFSDSATSIPTIKIDTNEFHPTIIDTVKQRFIYELPFETDSFIVDCNIVYGDTLYIMGIHLDNSMPGITYHALGVNGASVDSYLRCEHFNRDLDLINPDLVIFGLGINDATHSDFSAEEYEQNYLTLAERFSAANPNCAFIFVTNNDSYKRVRRNGKIYYEVNKKALLVSDVMYSLAKKTGGAVFDQFEIMGGLTSMTTWYQNKLAKKDRVHFTNAGYELMGKLFFEAFDKAYHTVID